MLSEKYFSCVLFLKKTVHNSEMEMLHPFHFIIQKYENKKFLVIRLYDVFLLFFCNNVLLINRNDLFKHIYI